MRSIWPPACSGRSPPATPTAPRDGPGGPFPLPQVPDHRPLGTLDFVVGNKNAIFLGPPGIGKTHLATGLGIRACQAGATSNFAGTPRDELPSRLGLGAEGSQGWA
ncbi:ATP-binding protein [Streptomyces bicolor]|uniref:ATP-binding protein n=1 Tax=Streptomyces bicolor TaxID=66874 RepID=UPI00245688AB|nr:ATP-binding protein [Streptomyces bicolor]